MNKQQLNPDEGGNVMKFKPVLGYLLRQRYRDYKDIHEELWNLCSGSGLRPSVSLVKNWYDGEYVPQAKYLPYLGILLGVPTDQFWERVA